MAASTDTGSVQWPRSLRMRRNPSMRPWGSSTVFETSATNPASSRFSASALRQTKSRHSSRCVPAKTEMPSAAPLATASAGIALRSVPSITDRKLPSPSGSENPSPAFVMTSGSSASNLSTSFPVRPTFSRNASETLTARSSGFALLPPPLTGIARWKRPRAGAKASSAQTLAAPADSPMMVTLPGSPPNAEMLSRIHFSASTWSSNPSFPVEGMRPPVTSFRLRNPSAPIR